MTILTPRCPDGTDIGRRREHRRIGHPLFRRPGGTGVSSSRSVWAAWDSWGGHREMFTARGRHRRTVVIAGDGSFFAHGMEIHTALQYRLPITFVRSTTTRMLCVTREQLFYEDR